MKVLFRAVEMPEADEQGCKFFLEEATVVSERIIFGFIIKHRIWEPVLDELNRTVKFKSLKEASDEVQRLKTQQPKYYLLP